MTEWSKECTLAQFWEPNHIIPGRRVVTIYSYTELRRFEKKFSYIFSLYSNARIEVQEINV